MNSKCSVAGSWDNEFEKGHQLRRDNSKCNAGLDLVVVEVQRRVLGKAGALSLIKCIRYDC